MAKGEGRRFGLVIRSAITVALLGYLLSIVPVPSVLEALATATPAFLLAGMTAQIVVRLLNALRIRVIARSQGIVLSYRAILSVLFTTGFYSLLLPGAVGGGAATLVKYLGHGVAPAAALASIIMNRLVDTMTAIGVGLCWWGLDHRAGGNGASPVLASLVFVTGPVLLASFHLVMFGPARLLHKTARFARSRRFENIRPYRMMVAVIGQFAEASNLSRRAALGMASVSVLQDLFTSGVAYCFAQAVGIELSFVTIAWMRAAISLLLLLPITFAGLGMREGALVFMTKAYGVAASAALVWSLLSFCGLLFIAGIGGLIEARSFWRRSASGQDS